MIINADYLVTHLKDKVRPTQIDASRHMICPDCGKRTKLNTLADGRRKCTVCGKKFRIHKVTVETKLRQCAEILLCFCIDFSPQKAAQITQHRYRLVSQYNDHFRRLIAETSVPQKGVVLPSSEAGDILTVRDPSRCRCCKRKIRLSDTTEKTPTFAIRLQDKDNVSIDPLNDDEVPSHCTANSSKGKFAEYPAYAGFICCGKLHRCTQNGKIQDDTEQLWALIKEWVRSHSGIRKKNIGHYLKELEWKYNNRAIHPDLQAQKIIELMPIDFLTSWL